VIPGERARSTSDDREAGGARHVVFWVGSQCLALQIDVVREVVDTPRVLPVPMAPPAVLGIASLRGTILSVLDTELLLSRPAMTGVAAKLLVLVQDGKPISGLAVDRVHGVVALPRADFLQDHSAAHHLLIIGYHPGVPGQLTAVLGTEPLLHHLDAMRLRASVERPTFSLAQELSR
jgi:chemotaxis signal transduction protein